MASKTALMEAVKAFRWRDVDAALTESPELLEFRGERGRNWLHLCCGSPLKGAGRSAADSIATADALLSKGLDIDGEAFSEGAWKATPLWFAVGWGGNLPLAEHLLERGCNPNFCLWAASYNRDLDAIRTLIAHGAVVDDPTGKDTPFLDAVKWSRFDAAEELLRRGADVNARDGKGMTALHLMLRNGSEPTYLRMIAAHRARGDIPDPRGATAIEVMRRKRDPDLRRLAEQLASGD